MVIDNLLYKYNIPSLLFQIKVDLPAVAVVDQPIAVRMPSNVGMIYGLSTSVPGFDTDNTALITAANAQNLYVNFKYGTADFITGLRLDSLIFADNTDGIFREENYYPVNIPGNISLDQSIIKNPQSVINARVVINCWYIEKSDMQFLVRAGAMYRDINKE